MQPSFFIIFYPRGNDVDKYAPPIYARITVNGKRSEFSIKRKVLLEKWSSIAEKNKGTSSEARELNRYMNAILTKIYRIQEDLTENGHLVTAKRIKNGYLGKDKPDKMLLEIF